MPVEAYDGRAKLCRNLRASHFRIRTSTQPRCFPRNSRDWSGRRRVPLQGGGFCIQRCEVPWALCGGLVRPRAGAAPGEIWW